jgi:hypothetical protein
MDSPKAIRVNVAQIKYIYKELIKCIFPKIYANDKKRIPIKQLFVQYLSEHLSASNNNFFTSTCCEQPTHTVLYTDNFTSIYYCNGNFYCSEKCDNMFYVPLPYITYLIDSWPIS